MKAAGPGSIPNATNMNFSPLDGAVDWAIAGSLSRHSVFARFYLNKKNFKILNKNEQKRARIELAW